MNLSQDKVMTISEAAKHCACHANTLRRATKSGELEHIRMGPTGQRKFRMSALNAWLDRHTVAVTK